MSFVEKENIKAVAHIKRLLEYITLEPGFYDKYLKDPYATIKEVGLDVDPDSINFEYVGEGCNRYMVAKTPGSDAEKYANFVNKKIDMREDLKKECIPSNPAIKKWRDRQVGRCNMELGAKVIGIIHSTFTLELSDGCSVGCEFCGLNAGKLKSVCRYTEENAQLFRGILTAAKETIGDAAGCGTMYFASEPLDNPDYELFLKDYREILGRLPQITTATAMRHTDRMHKLLEELNEYGDHIYRFSVLSLDMFHEIVKEFTPEELVLVELLPQYTEAPSNHFSKVGRNASDDGDGDTISCVSGFVVNMSRKELRLVTPTAADAEHPTGEHILYRGNFTDIESFREMLNMCVRKYMDVVIGPKDEIKLRKNVTYDKLDGEYEIRCDKGMSYKIAQVAKEAPIDILGEIFSALEAGYSTRRDIVNGIAKKSGGLFLQTDYIFHILNKMWSMGVIETKSGVL